MRLPDTAHTSRPWRIHEITPNFGLEDVWALPTPGGPDDFPRPVSLEKLSPRARGLIENERVAHLAFLDADGRPRVLPVTFAVAAGTVWTAIDQKPKRSPPARVRWLRSRPRAALCVDVYSDDWNRLAWVQLLGKVDVLELAQGDTGLAALTAKYPPYRESRPPGPLLRLTVERALEWSAAGYGV